MQTNQSNEPSKLHPLCPKCRQLFPEITFFRLYSKLFIKTNCFDCQGSRPMTVRSYITLLQSPKEEKKQTEQSSEPQMPLYNCRKHQEKSGEYYCKFWRKMICKECIDGPSMTSAVVIKDLITEVASLDFQGLYNSLEKIKENQERYYVLYGPKSLKEMHMKSNDDLRDLLKLMENSYKEYQAKPCYGLLLSIENFSLMLKGVDLALDLSYGAKSPALNIEPRYQHVTEVKCPYKRNPEASEYNPAFIEIPFTAMTQLTSGEILIEVDHRLFHVWNRTFTKKRIIQLTAQEDTNAFFYPLNNNRLVITTKKGKTMLWDTNSWKAEEYKEKTFKDIGCLLQLSDGRIVIGGGVVGKEDPSIKVLDEKSFKCLDMLQGHKRKIKCLVELDSWKGILASGSMDYFVRLWDLSTQTCVTCLENDCPMETMIELQDGRLAVALHDSKVTLWDLKEKKKDGVFKVATELVKMIQISKDSLIYACELGDFYQVDLKRMHFMESYCKGFQEDLIGWSKTDDGKIITCVNHRILIYDA